MALVRVYCGLASADPAARTDSKGPALIAAVVDDAGRLLEVREIGDDPAGYGQLGLLLSERPGGVNGVAVASDSDDHLVVSLLTASGRPLAVADDDSVDDFAERFADDDSPDEITSPQTARRAVGLARALQAGALSAITLPMPRDLAAYQPILSAHSALVNGRQSAAVALREVLRELYPAALRAYPNPAAPVPLAVLDALPEPGSLISAAAARGRDAAVEAVAADLAATGIADKATFTEAVTALRIAVSETPRRRSTLKSLAETTRETVRQAVAALRAYDAGCAALMATLAARTASQPVPARQPTRRTTPAAPAVPPSAKQPATSLPRPTPAPAARYQAEPAATRPVSAPPPPPPGITPIAPTQRNVPPAETGEPFRPTLTTAAMNSARAERQRATAASAKSATSEPATPQKPISATDYSVPVPTPRPTKPAAPPGSRANWPLVSASDDRANVPNEPEAGLSRGERSGPEHERPEESRERVTPPWLADDLPPEPPMLRLVEPPLADHALRDGLGVDDRQAAISSLRLVESDTAAPAARSPRPPKVEPSEPPAPPVADEGDGDLLIFAATRSAWFVRDPDDSDVGWGSIDSGWQVAEQAAKPAVGEQTKAGLPRRVPQANLVPGSPLRDERPLRVVRDPARIAENTTGYFRGWRRGQQIGGYAVGGRPGRESAGGWDFSRDHDTVEDGREYEYRSARY